MSEQIPAAVTDHSSYELGVLMERERCAKIAEEWADENWNNGMRSCWETDAAKEIAAAIRGGQNSEIRENGSAIVRFLIVLSCYAIGIAALVALAKDWVPW